MNDLQEQLSSTRVEDKDGTVDRFCCQIAFEGLVDCHSIYVCVVDEPKKLSQY